MSSAVNLEDEPWYRNPWVWLMISIPALTVVACMYTIYLALTNPDYLVTDAVPDQAVVETIPR